MRQRKQYKITPGDYRNGPNTTSTCAPREAVVQHAREFVEALDSLPIEKRRWLVASPPDSYGELRYHAELHVREGSPARGFVLVVEDGLTVIAMGPYGRMLHRWTRP